MKPIEISGRKIRLSSNLALALAGRLAGLANDEKISLDIGAHGFPFPYTRQDAVNFFQMNREDGSKPFALDFLIYAGSDVVGVIGLKDIEYYDRNAHIGYWIGREYWGKGYATEAVSLLAEYCRKDLGLVRLHTWVLDYNLASLRVLMKNRFDVEGYQRNCYRMRDGFHSMFVLGRLL